MKKRNQMQRAEEHGRPLVLLSLQNNTDPNALRIIVELARSWEWDLLDLNITEGNIFGDRQPSGALIQHPANREPWQGFKAQGLPIVRLGNWPDVPSDEIPTVLLDQAEIGHLAARHFHERGFKNVTFITRRAFGRNAPFRIMLESFMKTCDEMGISASRLTLYVHDTEAARKRLLRKLQREMERAEGPLGVFLPSDKRAIQVSLVLSMSNYQIPEKVAILGVGNTHLCDLAPVKMSSIDPNVEHECHEAMRLLRRMMEGAPPPTNWLMIAPRGVVERQSTDILAVADPHVAAALRYMWDHLKDDLCVDAVAKAAGITRRQLERAFRVHLGRGVNAELRRKRLEFFANLLVSRDAPITDLALESGFRTMVHLQRTFKKIHGMTPCQYRKKMKS